MKLITVTLFFASNLSASALGPVSPGEGHCHYSYKMTPTMGSCPMVVLIGGYEQKCYGYGIMDGSGPSGTWYHCSLRAEHKWISKGF